MFNLEEKFRPGHPVSQVPVSWFNKVAHFINSLVGGKGINVFKQENGICYVELTDDINPTPVDPTDPPGAPANVEVSALASATNSTYGDQAAVASTLEGFQKTFALGVSQQDGTPCWIGPPDSGSGSSERQFLKMTVCTGMFKQNSTGQAHHAVFSDFYFDAGGRLVKVDFATHSYKVV